MSLSLTFDRSSISLADLVVGTDFTDDMWLPSDAVARPDMDYRRTYAPDSPFVPGRTLLMAVLEASTLPVNVYCQGATAAALTTVENTLIAAVSQFAYDVTLTVDGETWTWIGEPTRPAFGPVVSGMVTRHISKAVLTIPINAS